MVKIKNKNNEMVTNSFVSCSLDSLIDSLTLVHAYLFPWVEEKKTLCFFLRTIFAQETKAKKQNVSGWCA